MNKKERHTKKERVEKTERNVNKMRKRETEKEKDREGGDWKTEKECEEEKIKE